MIDVCLLGTGGMLPLPYRALTSLMLRYNGSNILIDCGEGTQNQIRQKGWSFKPIDVICITHFHADHISGLPGLLLTMGNAERTEPLTMVGPKGLAKVVNSLRIIAPELPFDIKFIELEKDFNQIEICGLKLEAFRVNHRVTCYGYNIVLDRAGKFDVAKAKGLGLPVNFWSLLQKGEMVEYEGNTYTSDMVMGESRKGLKITYCTDTRPIDSIADNAKDADLFICEGMYGEEDKLDKAKEHKHMTMMEAANLAKRAEVKEMWLTHYSPATARPYDYYDKIKTIFPDTVIPKDLASVELKFEE
ncbi:MAG: ribonuclease Z [Lachnospiraceae bacterium]|nr:ribonuclease Z [Lachnospiraceae bacterium]